MKKTLLLAFTYVIAMSAFSQGTYVPLGGDTYDYIDRLDIKYGKILPTVHTSTKPYLRSETAHMAEALHFSNLKQNKVNEFQLQYLMDDSPEWLDSVVSKTRRPLWKKLYREPASFAHVESKKKGVFDLRVNPIIDLHVGGETNGSRFIFDRSVGVEFRGNIKKVLSFYSATTGDASRPMQYVADLYSNNPNHDASATPGMNLNYYPGVAYFKPYSSKIFKFNDGANWFNAVGYVNVNVLDYLNISFGRDKNFWGDGIRSLFLSDNSAPYLFLKEKLTFWRIEYTSMITQLTSDYSMGGDALLDKKYGSFQKLDIKITWWLNMGLFEGNISRRSGNNFDVSYLNPVIFYRAVDHALGNPDKEFIGGYFKANAINHLSFYGQFLVSEFNVSHLVHHDGWRDNKYAVQLGMKYIDIAPGLDAQVEFNAVRPFTYSTSTFPEEDYSNYNQALGDPLGNNFFEGIIKLNYQPKPRWTINLKLMIARVGDDTIVAYNGATPIYSNFGSDISRTDTASHYLGNKIGQGARGIITNFDLRVSYQAWHNIYIDGEMIYRNKASAYKADIGGTLYPYSSSSFYIGVGLRMNFGVKSNFF
jgi:hypothetical protein